MSRDRLTGLSEPARTGRYRTRKPRKRPPPLCVSRCCGNPRRSARPSASEAGRRKSVARSGVAKQPRASRQAKVEVRATRVTLRPPWRPKRSLPAVAVNVVLVREPHPPEGDVPVEWVLLTSLSIDTVKQVRQVIAYYSVRWMVEVFFRTLKSGCRAEERRFEQIDRQLRVPGGVLDRGVANALRLPWGRAGPEMSC